MDSILFVGIMLFALVSVVLVGLLTLLLYRHPNHAGWLEGETASTVVMILLMGAGIFSFAWLARGLISLNFDPLAAIALTTAIFTGVTWGLWKALRMRARLEAAAEGRSPFRIAATAHERTKRAA